MTHPMDQEDTPKVPFSPDEVLDKFGMLQTGVNEKYCPIAIVGIGLRMPGAENVAEFEDVMIKEECAISAVPADRWHFEDFYHKEPHVKGHYVIPKMGFCDKFFHFDAGYFGISPRETLMMDPQQRQVLEIADEALQDAGYTKDTIPNDTGVYVGMGIIDFPGVLVENRMFYNGHSLTGFSHSCAANRISHHYGITGPSVAVDTACAASLTALHMGCMSIWNKENRVALAGATSHLYSPETTIAFSHLGVLSATGTSAPFDHTNDGYVRAEGTSIVVMKALEEAIKDGDHVYCVIRGSTSAHNGNSNSLTLPSAEAQEELIRRCYDYFHIPMKKVSFVEAHGTGTPVGDPLETKALGRTFGAAHKEPMPISSAKSNFGHLEVAAGMVQVVKTALMLDKCTFYKQLNWTAPNPRIDFNELNLRIQLKHEPYTKKDKFLIGVNTFGFGGSLVHMVFEEFRPKLRTTPSKLLAGWNFGENYISGRKIAVPLSAKVDVALRNTVQKWMVWSNELDAQVVTGWLATRREHFKEERLVFLAESGADFRNKLQFYLNGDEHADIITGSVPATYTKPAICFIYPGWGQQWSDMGRGLYKHSEEFKMKVDECDSIFMKLVGYSAIETYKIFIDLDEAEKLDPTYINSDACKPAILFFQVGLTALLGRWGIKPDVVLGVGLGEQTGAFVSGALTLDEIIRLMVIRMKAPPKEEFLAKLKESFNGKAPRKATSFLSTITGFEQTSAFDPEYWWKNITSERNINGTIHTALSKNSHTVFIELGSSPMMSPAIEDLLTTQCTESSVVCCGNKGEDDWTSAQRVMGKLHASGYPIDWSKVTNETASYAPIPIYGWDDKLYRLESPEYFARRMGLNKRTYKDVHGKINLDFFAYLSDYILGENPVFSTASFLEYFSEFDTNEMAVLRSINIYGNPIIPPFTTEGYAQTMELVIKQSKNHLRAYTNDGVVQAEAFLTNSRPVSADLNLDIFDIRNRCWKRISGVEIYNRFSGLGLTYKTFFRLMNEVNVGESEVFASFDAPHSRMRHERLQAVVIDAAFQTAISAFTIGAGLYLPKHIGHLQMFVGKVPPTTQFCVHAVLKEWNLQYIKTDMKICSKDGKVWVTLLDVMAENQDSTKTNVGNNSCIFTTKWQKASAVLKSISSIDTSLKIGSSQNMRDQGILNHIMESLFSLKDCSQDIVENHIELYPHIATDISSLMELADGTKDTIKRNEFLQESVIVKSTIFPYIEVIVKSIKEALLEKDVVRICEFGDSVGILIRYMSELLTGETSYRKVDFVYCSDNDEILKSASHTLKDIANIKFMNIEKCQDTMTETFDVAVTIDWSSSSHKYASRMKDILIHKGHCYLITSMSRHLTNFILGTDVANTDLNILHEMKNAGFYDVIQTTTVGDSWMTMFVGDKQIIGKQGRDSNFVIITESSSKMSDELHSLLPKASTKLLIDFMLNDVDQRTDLIFILGEGEDRMEKTQKILNILRCKENAFVERLYIIAQNESHDHEVEACLGLMRAYSQSLPVYTVEITDDDLTKSIVNITHVITSESPERHFQIGKDILLPRISQCKNLFQYNDQNKACWKIQTELRGKELLDRFCHTGCTTLGSDEVRVEVRSISFEQCKKGSPMSFAGTVEASNCTEMLVGTAVTGLTLQPVRSHVTCSSKLLCSKPSLLTWSETTSSLLAYSTVYAAIADHRGISEGITVLVNAGNGFLGQAAMNLTKLRGCRVMVVCNDPDNYKEMIQGLGVITVVNPKTITFKQEVMGFTNGKGVDSIIQIESNVPDDWESILNYGATIYTVNSSMTRLINAPNVRYRSICLASQLRTETGNSETRAHSFTRSVAEKLEDHSLSPIVGNSSHISNAVLEIESMTANEIMTVEIPEDYKPRIETMALSLKKNASYLIVSDDVEISLEYARWLSDNGAGYVILMSKTEGYETFINATKAYVNTIGSDLNRIKVSSFDKKHILSSLQGLDDSPPIRGIFNLVQTSSNCKGNDIHRHVGLANALDQVSDNFELDHFILISSLDNLWMNGELPAMCAVGAAMDAICQKRKDAGLPGLSLHLGPVQGIGAACLDPELQEVYDVVGSHSMHIHEYLSILGNLLQSHDLPTVLAIGKQDWARVRDASYTSSLTSIHLVEEKAESESEGGENMQANLEQKCREYISELTGTTLDLIQLSHPVTEYGVDSLMSQDIISWAQKTFKVTLEQTEVFGGLSISHLLAKVPS